MFIELFTSAKHLDVDEDSVILSRKVYAEVVVVSFVIRMVQDDTVMNGLAEHFISCYFAM